MPLANGGAEPDPLESGKGAVPGCVEKGPFGGSDDGGGGRADPAAPAVEVTVTVTGTAVEVTVTVTWTVEVTVSAAGQPLEGLPGTPE